MASTNYDIQIVIDAQNKASNELKKFANDTKNASKQYEKTSKQIKKETKGIETSLKALGPAIAGAFTVGAVIQFGKEMFNVARELELLDNKASIVLGDFRGEVEATGAEVARAMGLTKNEFVSATTNIADILIPMEFTREQAAGMATDMTQLAGAISEWSNGQFDATEASQILAKALVGETEQLKSVGIVIDQSSKAFNERIQLLMEDEGLTLQQAKAMDIQRQVMEKSVDAQVAYAEGAGSIIRKQAELNASVNTLKETLATALTPAISQVTGELSQLAIGAEGVISTLMDLNSGAQTSEEGFLNLGSKILDMGVILGFTSDSTDAYADKMGELSTEIQKTRLEEEKAINDTLGLTGVIDGLNKTRVDTSQSRAQLVAERQEALNTINAMAQLAAARLGQAMASADFAAIQKETKAINAIAKAYKKASQTKGTFSGGAGGGGGGVAAGQKAAASATKDLNKELEKEAKALEKQQDAQIKDIFNQITKGAEDSAKSIEDLTNEIAGLQKQQEDLSASASGGLAARAVEIQKELAEVQKSGVGGPRAQKLAEELKLARSGTTEEEIERARTIAEESPTEKIMRETEEKKAILAQEQAALETRVAQEEATLAGLDATKRALETSFAEFDSIKKQEEADRVDVLIGKYMALNAARAGQSVGGLTTAAGSPTAAAGTTNNVNVTLGGVQATVREEADINKMADALASMIKNDRNFNMK